MTPTAKAPTAPKLIRQILKENFQSVKFSVTSDHNSVRICYTDGPTANQVENLCADFKAGSFNGMEDIYEYSNNKRDLPQVKYIFVDREISEAVQASISEKFGIAPKEWSERFRAYGSEVIYRHFQEQAY